jgi:hypothetical protein
MNGNTNMAGAMMNAGPWFGVGGGVAALAAIPHPEAKLVTCAVMFAVAAGSAMHKYFFTAQAVMEPADYPLETTANPWERDGGPLGL